MRNSFSSLAAYLSYLVFFTVIFCLFSVGIWGVNAQDNVDPTSSFVCDDSLPNIYRDTFNEYYTESQDFDTSFSALTAWYHQKMNTEFNTAFTDLSRSVYTGESEEKACTPIQYEQKDNDSLLTFITGRKKEYKKYECALLDIYSQHAFISPQSNVSTFSEGIAHIQDTEYRVLEEIENSNTALLLSLQMYSEMRQWYPVHRDLECLISEMELYRNAVRGFIDTVVRIPAKYYNYGSRTQQ